MLKRLTIIIWLPFLRVMYSCGLLYLFPIAIVTAGFYEIKKRDIEAGKWSVIPYIHLLGVLWLFTMTANEIWFVAIVAMTNDAAGLIGGKYLNFWEWSQIKIFAVSPNKTLGGFLYGIAIGMIAGILAIYFLQLPIFWIYIIPILCLSGVMGDLLASKFKRSRNVKDSGQGLITGKLLYGHGGVYDRFDGPAMACHVWGIYLLLMKV